MAIIIGLFCVAGPFRYSVHYKMLDPTSPLPGQLPHPQNLVSDTKLCVQWYVQSLPSEQTEFKESQVEKLEKWIDDLDCHLPPLENFILPVGNKMYTASLLVCSLMNLGLYFNSLVVKVVPIYI